MVVVETQVVVIGFEVRAFRKFKSQRAGRLAPAAKRFAPNLSRENSEYLLSHSFRPDSLFHGEYGSALENQLEMEMDVLLDKLERIGMAKTRWGNGRKLLQHAYQQLAYAVQRWKEMFMLSTA